MNSDTETQKRYLQACADLTEERHKNEQLTKQLEEVKASIPPPTKKADRKNALQPATRFKRHILTETKLLNTKMKEGSRARPENVKTHTEFLAFLKQAYEAAIDEFKDYLPDNPDEEIQKNIETASKRNGDAAEKRKASDSESSEEDPPEKKQPVIPPPLEKKKAIEKPPSDKQLKPPSQQKPQEKKTVVPEKKSVTRPTIPENKKGTEPLKPKPTSTKGALISHDSDDE